MSEELEQIKGTSFSSRDNSLDKFPASPQFHLQLLLNIRSLSGLVKKYYKTLLLNEI